MICGSGGSKSRLAQAAGAEPSGQMRDEKLHAVVARSTFPNEKVQSTPGADHFWQLRCRKSERRCGAKHISKSKCTKHTIVGPLFGSWDVEKVHAVVARSTFRSQNAQNTTCSRHFSRFRCRFAWQARGIVHLVKVSKTWGFCRISKNQGRRGTCEEDLQRCIFRGRRSTKDMFMRDVRRSGRWFPEMGCILEHQIFSFAEMILPDRCSNSYDLASLFRSRRSTLEEKSQNALVRGRQLCTQLSIFKEVSQNCFVFDVVNFDLFRFWCCQVQKLRKSRRIVSFLTLTSSKIEEVSQNCFVFDVAKFKNWGCLAELLRFSSLQIDRQTGTQTDRTDR